MNDPHNILKSKCNKAFNAVKARLKYEYKAIGYKPIAQDCEKLKKTENWRGLFLISKTILDIDFKLIIAIPVSFPYEFPKIYLYSEVSSDYKNLPHLDEKLFICTFDPSEAIPNPDEPALILARVISKAIKILKEGLLKENFNEYSEEFLAYWDLDTKYNIISIITPDDQLKEICVIPLIPAYNELYSYLIADNIQNGLIWAGNLNIKIDKKKICRGLYLPLKKTGIPPFPNTNEEIVNYLKEANHELLVPFYKFLDVNKRPNNS